MFFFPPLHLYFPAFALAERLLLATLLCQLRHEHRSQEFRTVSNELIKRFQWPECGHNSKHALQFRHSTAGLPLKRSCETFFFFVNIEEGAGGIQSQHYQRRKCSQPRFTVCWFYDCTNMLNDYVALSLWLRLKILPLKQQIGTLQTGWPCTLLWGQLPFCQDVRNWTSPVLKIFQFQAKSEDCTHFQNSLKILRTLVLKQSDINLLISSAAGKQPIYLLLC